MYRVLLEEPSAFTTWRPTVTTSWFQQSFWNFALSHCEATRSIRSHREEVGGCDCERAINSVTQPILAAAELPAEPFLCHVTGFSMTLSPCVGRSLQHWSQARNEDRIRIVAIHDNKRNCYWKSFIHFMDFNSVTSHFVDGLTSPARSSVFVQAWWTVRSWSR